MSHCVLTERGHERTDLGGRRWCEGGEAQYVEKQRDVPVRKEQHRGPGQLHCPEQLDFLANCDDIVVNQESCKLQ